MLLSSSDRWLVSIQCEMVVQIVFVCHLGYAVSIADAGKIHRASVTGSVVALGLVSTLFTMSLPPF